MKSKNQKVVSLGCEAWRLALREEHRIRVLGIRW